ncbi:hypothetical protein HPB48_019217 [Haemaphysalis longicornis]|uniref:Peptidase M13 C-terminal domain-containing protein n=1 Tax=Haemaphysalis longicornis TaxID=44386 RepID=A0A9J6G9P0_HAELO|nr:hypothetical protein HPB48_019217 [Haemaphysalis longicornis]
MRCGVLVVSEMTFVAGDLFTQWFFPGGHIVAAQDLAERIVNATRYGFYNLSWIDRPTRQQALLRFATLDRIIARPENLSTPAQLDEYYSFLMATPEGGSYPQELYSMKRARAAAAVELLQASRPKLMPVKQDVPMVIVNAFYVPIYHMIVMPPAIMFSPFFQREGVPAALNYGSLGHVLGHEITHSFDEDFGLYDERGQRHDWWSPQSRANFGERLHCLRGLYNDVAEGRGVPFGDTALEENFADCGGIVKALRAFRFLGPQPSEKLAKREFTAEQLFFVSSCYKWCSPLEKRPEGDREGVVKIYSPMDMRCNVPLMNIPEFAAAFQCSSTSRMASYKRCEVL